MCMCIHLCVCVATTKCLYMHVQTHACVDTSMYMHVCVHTCTFACVHVCKHVFAYTCISLFTHVHSWTHMHAHAHMYMSKWLMHVDAVMFCAHCMRVTHTFMLAAFSRPTFFSFFSFIYFFHFSETEQDSTSLMCARNSPCGQSTKPEISCSMRSRTPGTTNLCTSHDPGANFVEQW